MKRTPRIEAVSLTLGALFAGVGIMGLLVFDKDIAPDASPRQRREERASLDCESWRSDAERSECVVAWRSWQNCRRRLPTHDREREISCEHQKYRFEERQSSDARDVGGQSVGSLTRNANI
jgi:hypothetical protein